MHVKHIHAIRLLFLWGKVIQRFIPDVGGLHITDPAIAQEFNEYLGKFYNSL